jgi:hypothetical protein
MIEGEKEVREEVERRRVMKELIDSMIDTQQAV